MKILDKIREERKTASRLFDKFDQYRKLTVIAFGGWVVTLLLGWWPNCLFIGAAAFVLAFIANHYGNKSFYHWRKAQNLARLLAERIKEARPGSGMQSEESSEGGRLMSVARPIVEHPTRLAR